MLLLFHCFGGLEVLGIFRCGRGLKSNSLKIGKRPLNLHEKKRQFESQMPVRGLKASTRVRTSNSEFTKAGARSMEGSAAAGPNPAKLGKGLSCNSKQKEEVYRRLNSYYIEHVPLQPLQNE